MGALLVTLLAVSFLEIAAADFAPAASTETRDQRQGIQQKVQSELDDLAAKARVLEAKAKKTGAKDRQRLNKDFKKLKSELHVAQSKLQRLKGASQDAWESLKRELDRAEDKARASYDKLVDKIR